MDDVPIGLLAYLLKRSLEGSFLGAWAITVHDDKDLMFHLHYTALGAGLDAAALKFICESMAKEAGVFDAVLREANLLR